MQHHGEGLLRELTDSDLGSSGVTTAELVDAIKLDYRGAALRPADRAMLDYVAKLTETPAKMVEADVVALRTAGYSDEAILDINQITGFFAWCNRTVDGLGVELEAFWGDPSQTNV